MHYYATENPDGVIRRNGKAYKSCHLHRFSTKAARDMFVATDPECREALRFAAPIVRRANRDAQAEWPYPYLER